MRRKQTSIRSSRSALPHRYLRYISWNGGHRPPQAGFSAQSAHALFSRRRLYPKAAIAAALPLLPPGGQNKYSSDLSPRKRKTSVFPFSRAPLRVIPPALLYPQALRACRPRSICGRSIARPCVIFRGPPINKKMRARSIAPRTRKSVDFSLKKNTRRHAWLSRSCFGRNRRPAFTTALFPFSFFTKEKKKENRSKFSRFEYIARTHFVRPHDVRDWPVAPRPLKFM